MTTARLWGAALALLVAGPVPARAALTPNPLASEVERIRDGKVALHFAARPGVYGDGRSVTITRDRHVFVQEGGCCDTWMNGPVFVAMTLRQGKVERLDYCVGGKQRERDGVTDLGEIAPQAAAEFFVSLAAKASPDAGENAISAASFADDVTVWPQLLQLARNRDLATGVRKKALFWVGQAAGDSIVPMLDSVSHDRSEDLEVRKAAVFAISQRPHAEAVAALLRIARSKIDPEVRRSAFFWLAQYDEPEIADFFESILVGK